jgi:serine protease Do
MTARTLCLTLLLALPLASAQVMNPSARRDTLASVVQVVAYSDQASIAFGSGVIVSPAGHVITNWHVIADDEGRLHRNLWVVMGDPDRPELVPSRFYGARFVAAETELDLALLQLSFDDRGLDLTGSERFIAAPVARSSGVMIGDPLFIIGYPFISGATVTLTVGTVSGFVGEDRFDSGRAWIKTDARVQSGNSGGGAFDSDGNLLAIATAAVLYDGERQEYLRPADLLGRVLSRHIPGFALVDPSGTVVAAAAGASPAIGGAAGSPAAAPGATPAAATDRGTGLSSSRSGVLTPSSDWYFRGRYAEGHPLDLEVGSRVRIRLTSEDFDAYLVVLDPDDEEVVNIDDTPGFGTDVDATFVARRRGRYLVIATTTFREQTGRYQLLIDTTSSAGEVAAAGSARAAATPPPATLAGLWSGALIDAADGRASLSVTIRAFGEVLDGSYRANFSHGPIAGSLTGLWRDGWAQVLLIPFDDDRCPLLAFARWDGEALTGSYEGEGCVGSVRGRLELQPR